MIPGMKIDIDNIDDLIKENMAFIIRVTSNFTKRYVRIEQDEEFSIALLAFTEAVEKFDEEKGNFLSFARLVIESRLMNEAKKHKQKELSLDQLAEDGIEFSKDEKKIDKRLEEEIQLYCDELHFFGLDLEQLADYAPKHRDTKKVAIDAAEQCSMDPPIVKTTYQKKKLPIRQVSRLTLLSEKTIKHSKWFILATMLIFVKNLKCLISWISEVRCQHVS